MLVGSKGWTGTIAQRTGTTAPLALMKWNALRLLYVLFSKPDETGRLRINCIALVDSGCLARKAFILA